MSKSEILTAVTKLSSADRRELMEKLLELEADDWLDSGDLTDEERALIETRLAAHRKNPDAAVPWEDVEARLVERLGS